jgi:SagB-type dehydrogenase family enzyme
MDFSRTDQHRGVPPPPLEMPAPSPAKLIALSAPGSWKNVRVVAVETAIRRRQSHREYSNAPLQMDELSFLLWATQGIRSRIDAATALRTVPSAGARHALETHLCALNVAELERAVYRYLPVRHQLVLERTVPQLARELVAGAFGQQFVAEAAAVFVWAAVPYRMEWRYGAAAHKLIALDAGHVCQNLYLACEAIGAGCCAVAAYHQQMMDELLGLDGEDEFAIYMAAVGKL